jgi:mono/diheme cytochrome c family protein
LPFALCLLPFALLLTGCRQDMHNQPRYEALEPSVFFNDGQASRHPVEGTIPRGQLANDAYAPTNPGASIGAASLTNRMPGSTSANQAAANTGMTAGASGGAHAGTQIGAGITTGAPGSQPAATRAGAQANTTRFPYAITAEVLTLGQKQYNISCAPCHGHTGYGDGMVVRRGFPRPPSYHTDQLRNATNDHFYDVITNGFGRMWSYADQVEPRDRWAVVAYIRTLQLSQHATLADVPADKQSQLGNQGTNQQPNQQPAQPQAQPPAQPQGGRQQ